MKSKFRLKGLNRPKSMTCYPLNNENIFWPKVDMSQERFDALWKYCKGHWKEDKFVEIEHDGFYEDGTPINPIVKNVTLS